MLNWIAWNGTVLYAKLIYLKQNSFDILLCVNKNCIYIELFEIKLFD